MLGIGDGKTAVTGAEIQEMSTATLQERCREVDVFARASPEYKLRLVKAMQASRQIVAITAVPLRVWPWLGFRSQVDSRCPVDFQCRAGCRCRVGRDAYDDRATLEVRTEVDTGTHGSIPHIGRRSAALPPASGASCSRATPRKPSPNPASPTAGGPLDAVGAFLR
jgi:hypothetical protein